MWLLAACASPAELPPRVETPVDPDAALPLIVVLHGLGGTPESMAELVGACALPARVVALRGPDRSGEGWSWFPTRFVETADGGHRAEFEPGAVRSAAEGVADGIRALVRARRVVGDPLVTGFSQGGILSFTLAATHPELLGGALPLAGSLPEGTRVTLSPDPVIAFHGRDDDVVPFADGEAAVRRLVAAGVPAELRAYDGVGHTLRADERFAWCAALRRLLPPPGPGAAP